MLTATTLSDPQISQIQLPIQVPYSGAKSKGISVSPDALINLLIDRNFLGSVSEKNFPVNTPWKKRGTILLEWAQAYSIPETALLPLITYFDEQQARMKFNAQKPKPRPSKKDLPPPPVIITLPELETLIETKVAEVKQAKPAKTAKSKKASKQDPKWEDDPKPVWQPNLQWFARCETCGHNFEPDMNGQRVGFRWRFDGKWHSYHINPSCFRKGYEGLFSENYDWKAYHNPVPANDWEDEITH